MFGLGWPELLVIGVAVMVLFGAKRLPETARSLGKGLREFKNAVTGVSGDERRTDEAAHRDRCGKCSAVVSAHATFCAQCGTKVAQTAGTASPA